MLALGTWSRDWLKREITAEDADPALLIWDMQRNLHLDRLPQRRVVTFFRYRDAPEKKRAWWLVAEVSGADLCLSDPGFSVDFVVDAEARAMAEIWLGRLDLGAAMRSRRVRIRDRSTSYAACPTGSASTCSHTRTRAPSSPSGSASAATATGDRRRARWHMA